MIKSIRNSLAFLFYINLLQIISNTNAVTFICRDGDSILLENEYVNEAFTSMTNRFEFNKTGSTQDEPVSLQSVYDYTTLTGRNYVRIKEICENELNYDLCTVTSVTNHFDVVDDLPVVRETTEKNRPVCFPKSCSEDDIALLHPSPANCDESGVAEGSCKIISYETNCPDRNVTNTLSCANDILPNDSNIVTRINLIEAAVLSSCAAVVAGTQTDTCSVEYGTFEVSTEIDFTNGQEASNTYGNYESECLYAGGQICDAGIEAVYNLPNGNLGDLVLTEKFVEFPFCVSLECTKDEDRKDIAVERFRRYTRESIVSPPCLENVCNVTVTSFSCNGGMPSSAPAVATPSPSISKEPTLTWAPTLNDRAVKTKSPVGTISSSSTKKIANPKFFSFFSIVIGFLTLNW